MDYNKPLNIVLVGDPEVGKSTLISKCHQFNPTSENGGFFTRDFKIPDSYKPTSLSSHLTSIYQNKGDRSMMYSVFRANITDTGGGRRYDHVRPLAYMDADVFLVCFDICNRQSFLNVSSRWLPEIKKYEPQVPVLLVGTKADLKSRRQVTEAEINETSKSLCQNKYIETTSYDKNGLVYALFDQAVELAFTYRKDHSKSRIKKTKDKNSEQSFDVTTMEIASDPPECPRGSSTLSSNWQVTLDGKRAADVILKFSDQSPEIHAHKFVLALASTTFRKLFTTIDNMCGAVINGRNEGQTCLPTDEAECCKCCAKSENSTAQEFDCSFLKKTPFFQIHCAHCSGQKVVDTKEGKNKEPFRTEALPIRITFKACIKRPVFLCVLEWMYTGHLDISDEPEQSFIEDLQKILLELDIQALKFRLLRILRQIRRLNTPPSAKGHNLVQHGNIPIPPPLPPSARGHNQEQHSSIPIPPPLPPLPPSARGHNQEQHSSIPMPPPLPPVLPSARGHNQEQHGNIPMPPPLLPSARGHNQEQHGNIPMPPPLPPLLPSARGHNQEQHGNIPMPPPLPPLLPSARGHNQEQHGNIPMPPPLLPSARGHNQEQHGNIPMPPPLPPLLPSARGHNQEQHGNIPMPPPLPPLLPSARGHNQEQHGNIPMPPPLPPLLPSARGHNQEQHSNIPMPPPLPPLPPSARGHNQEQHGNIPMPPPLPPLPPARGHNQEQHGNIPMPPPLPPLPPARGHNQEQHDNIPMPPPLPRPHVSKSDLVSVYKDMWEYAHSLLIDGDLQPDLVLIVDDTHIQVHRVVLISRSPVMAAMLDGSFRERDLNTIRLPGVPLDHFRTVLEFMYSDRCTIDETNIKDIMKLADWFDVPSLVNRCQEYIIHSLFEKTITEDSLERARDLVMDTIYLSETFNARLLHKWCLHFVATNYDLFEKEEDFKSIWSQNAEYMENNRWPTQNYIQILKRYKASKSLKLNEKILRKRRRNTTKCACCMM